MADTAAPDTAGSRFTDPAGDSPGFLLWQVTMAWQREVAEALRPLDLTHVQFVLLACTWWLGRSDTPPSQLDVARQAGTDPKMTSEVLRRLEAKGLVVRAVDPSDTRVRRTEVTAAGAELARRAVGVVESADARFFGPHSLEVLTSLRPLGTRQRTARPPQKG